MANVEAAGETSNAKLKIAILVAVIVIALGWVIYLAIPTPQPEVPPMDDFGKAQQKISLALDQANSKDYATVDIVRDEASKGIILRGWVESQELADALKQKVAATDVGMPIKNEVVIRKR